MPSAPGPSPYTDHKESVRTASTGDITLDDLPAMIDGISMSYGDRFLAKDQDDATENGIYIYLGEDESAEVTTGGRDGQLTSGALVVVEQGAENGDSLWILTTDDPIEVGETELVFEEIGAEAPPAPAGGGVVASMQHPDGNQNFPASGGNVEDDDFLSQMVLTVPGDGVNDTVIIAYIPQLSASTANMQVRVVLRDEDGNSIGGQGQTNVSGTGPTAYTVMGLLPAHSGDKDVRVHIGSASSGESLFCVNDGGQPYQQVSMITAIR